MVELGGSEEMIDEARVAVEEAGVNHEQASVVKKTMYTIILINALLN